MTYEDWARLTVMSAIWIAFIGVVVFAAVKLARYPTADQPAHHRIASRLRRRRPSPGERPRCRAAGQFRRTRVSAHPVTGTFSPRMTSTYQPKPAHSEYGWLAGLAQTVCNPPLAR
jgi:hypothetical protein